MNEKALCDLLSLLSSHLQYDTTPHRDLLISAIQLNLCYMLSKNKESQNAEHFKKQIDFWLKVVKKDISCL
jgi:hypothetical protein